MKLFKNIKKANMKTKRYKKTKTVKNKKMKM